MALIKKFLTFIAYLFLAFIFCCLLLWAIDGGLESNDNYKKALIEQSKELNR